MKNTNWPTRSELLTLARNAGQNLPDPWTSIVDKLELKEVLTPEAIPDLRLLSSARKWITVLNIVLVLVVGAMLFSLVPNPNIRQTVKGSALLSDITMEDGFQYKDYPWFISESDFFAKSKMDEKTAILSQQGTLTLISDKQTQTYDAPKISIFPVYYFSSGKLTKVQLNAVFVEVNAFSACAKDLKIALDEYLKPRNGNTDFLDEVPPDTGEGLGMVTWVGNDSSGMVIATFNHTKTATDSNNYVISIEISPPGTR